MPDVQQVRQAINAAKTAVAGDLNLQSEALKDPLKFLMSAPYNLTTDELKIAYSDSTLNPYHPDHPASRSIEWSRGCFLCGLVQP